MKSLVQFRGVGVGGGDNPSESSCTTGKWRCMVGGKYIDVVVGGLEVSERIPVGCEQLSSVAEPANITCGQRLKPNLDFWIDTMVWNYL
eukprot:1924876-Amphidinium_carterae.1